MDHLLVCLSVHLPAVMLPPTHRAGHGDLCIHGARAGCVNLLLTIQQRVRPRYHVFGHIHEGMVGVPLNAACMHTFTLPLLRIWGHY